jgi:hypothetical protein
MPAGQAGRQVCYRQFIYMIILLFYISLFCISLQKYFLQFRTQLPPCLRQGALAGGLPALTQGGEKYLFYKIEFK